MLKRTEGKFTAGHSRMDMYKAFLETLKEGEKKPTYKEYSSVLNSFNKKVVDRMLNDSFEYLLPYRVGTLRIKKYKQKIKINDDGSINTSRLIPDWKTTRQLWEDDPEAKANKKRVFHTNPHTEGYNFKWHFANYRSNCINKSYYYFIPTRANKRMLAALLKDKDNQPVYYE
jgi:hypothetical protein